MVGPSADPAHIRDGNDSIAALKAIASAQAAFVSRSDRRGTNAAELRLWKIAGLTSDALDSGDPRLISRYDVIELNPQKHAGEKRAAAKIFANWLVSSEGQQAIGTYQVNGQKLFNPSAAAPK
jgi:tungstate transport system substrate-binding protein